jgi:hypothetical protein
VNYFKYFPTTNYYFGNETETEVFRNISIYADVINDIQDTISLYQDYYIQDGERPDQVSYKLYEDPTFHWTFFFINNKLKQSGWPVSSVKLLENLQNQYRLNVITTTNEIGTRFNVGERITGLSTGETATIKYKNLDMGQLAIDGGTNFGVNERIQSENDEIITLSGAAGPEYLVAHHYEDANGNWIDINPISGSGNEASATISNGSVTKITVNTQGDNYVAPEVSIIGGGGSGATAVANVNDGKIVTIDITNGGSNYSSPPTVFVNDTVGGPTINDTAVSLFDMYTAKNEELKKIKIIKPGKLSQVTNIFREVLK